MSGSSFMANEPLITMAEHMSLREQVAMLLGISLAIGVVVTIIDITSSMIYLANADQSPNNNTMMKALLVHNK